MKSRDVWDELKGKVDREVLTVLTAMAEDIKTQKQQVIGLAQAMNQMADVLAAHGTILDTQKSNIDHIKKNLDLHDKRYETVKSEEIMGIDEEIDKT